MYHIIYLGAATLFLASQETHAWVLPSLQPMTGPVCMIAQQYCRINPTCFLQFSIESFSQSS